ncbi:MAG: hypothetical protein PVJ61_06330 [Dehalococcoidia bacterium]|jgi:hypothetical protein
MLKQNKPIKKWLPPAKLYLDDLKQIRAILKEKATKIRIITEDYELEDSDELEDLETKRLQSMTIECSDPDIRLEFDKARATMYCAEDSEDNRAILSEIEAIIRRRSNALVRVLAHPLCFLGGAALFLFSIFLISAQTDVATASWWLSIVLLLVATLASVMSVRYNFLEYSTITLYARVERKAEAETAEKEAAPSPKRNRNLILILIMAALIGAVVGALVTALILGV